MQIVAIGKPLFEERTELPEAVEYSYQSGDHTLLLSMKNLHPKEIEAVREAEAEFGLYCENGVIFLLYRFGEALRGRIPLFRGGRWRKKTAKFPRCRKILRREFC